MHNKYHNEKREKHDANREQEEELRNFNNQQNFSEPMKVSSSVDSAIEYLQENPMHLHSAQYLHTYYVHHPEAPAAQYQMVDLADGSQQEAPARLPTRIIPSYYSGQYAGHPNRFFLANAQQDYFSYYRSNAMSMDLCDDPPPCKISRMQGFSFDILSGKSQKTMLDCFNANSDYFCSVPGRLSLLSSTCKYKVSISEIHRRISQPECLNASLLGGILRRAKSKNGGKQLRERLESIGVRLPPGRRKAAAITVLTAMVEGEALQLASDFNSICKTDFPVRECSEYLRKRHFDETSISDDEDYIRKIKVARVMAEEFVELLEKDRSPTTNKTEEPILDPEIQHPLSKFSMLTHGFGIPAIATGLKVYISYLQEMEASTKPKGSSSGVCSDNDNTDAIK